MDQDGQAPDGNAQSDDVIQRIEAALLAVRHEHGRRHPGPPFGQFPAGPGPWMRGAGRGGFGYGGPAGHTHGHHDHDHDDHHRHGQGSDGDAEAAGADSRDPGADARTPSGDPRGAAGDARDTTGAGHPGPARRGRPDGPLGRIARFRMLEALESAERDDRRLSISALAEAVGVDQPRASRLVQEGIERGMVRRVADPSDARRSLIELTAAGRSQIAGVRDRRRSTVERAIADFTPEEAQAFADLFSRFVRGLTRDDT